MHPEHSPRLERLRAFNLIRYDQGAGRGEILENDLFIVPSCVLIIATRLMPSRPGQTDSNRPRRNFIGGMSSSFISMRVPSRKSF